MRFFNCKLTEIDKYIGNRKIVFFGCGSWLNSVNYTELMRLKSQFAYVIDNRQRGKTAIGEIELPVLSPFEVKNEINCDIILTSPVYMYDMYRQLQEMNLDDNIHCYAFPFMQMETPNRMDESLLAKVIADNRAEKIPKHIHCFWFSGEEKAEAYKRCIASWKEILPDYEITEWNKDNYNWHKHPFVEKAIESHAWAFASDYARLDVLNEYGGIYMDMDVEVFKRFDNLLHNPAIFSFSNHIQVDLAFMAAEQGNKVIKRLLELYDTVEIPDAKNGFARFFQPALIRDELVRCGIRMDGSLQKTENAVVFPSAFFMPQDYILFREYERTDYTYCVHYDNFGWSFSVDNKRDKKIRDNNILWNMLEK